MLSQRAREASTLVGPISSLPGNRQLRVSLAATKMLPKGLYGVETSYLLDAALRALRGAVFLLCKAKSDLIANVAL
eukprot:4200000-Lingulodinium_polyedra.AAC.1